ncbi:MAG TPA: hypothetical protein EYP43_00840, partial [Thermoplasmata archaeon]|nr:hypothetical protein [Thermoplasmata archaeon]
MSAMTVREMPPSERPRERMAALGPKALSDRELIAIILTAGSTDSVLEVAATLLATFNGRLRRLLNADVTELRGVPGIGLAKACQLRAVGELARRMARQE